MILKIEDKSHKKNKRTLRTQECGRENSNFFFRFSNTHLARSSAQLLIIFGDDRICVPIWFSRHVDNSIFVWSVLQKNKIFGFWIFFEFFSTPKLCGDCILW